MLRSAGAEDIQEILCLEGLLFDNSMSEVILKRELELGQGFVYVASGCIAGYALVRSDWDKYDLTRLGVTPSAQGQGIGRLLLERVVALGKPVVLTVLKTNYKAIRMYRRCAFEIVGQVNESEAWAMRRGVLQDAPPCGDASS
jgi:ribosomal protein S18 acetylase RimI-like enzyme